MIFKFNISMKTKIIILIIACIIGTGIVVNEGYRNYVKSKGDITAPSTSNYLKSN